MHFQTPHATGLYISHRTAAIHWGTTHHQTQCVCRLPYPHSPWTITLTNNPHVALQLHYANMQPTGSPCLATNQLPLADRHTAHTGCYIRALNPQVTTQAANRLLYMQHNGCLIQMQPTGYHPHTQNTSYSTLGSCRAVMHAHCKLTATSKQETHRPPHLSKHDTNS